MTPKHWIRSDLAREVGQGAELLGSQCHDCRGMFFPGSATCLDCGGACASVSLGTHGTLFSFTTVHMPHRGFLPPYTVGYARLPAGLLVFGPVIVATGAALEVGAPIRVVPIEVGEQGGERAWCYAFAVGIAGDLTCGE